MKNNNKKDNKNKKEIISRLNIESPSQELSWMRYVCHQRPDRSFHINGKPMPLCSRCTGFYTGFAIGLVLPIFLSFIYLIDVKILLIASIIFLSPMAIDGFTQLIGWRKSNNIMRFITGFLGGVLIGILLNWLLMNTFFLR